MCTQKLVARYEPKWDENGTLPMRLKWNQIPIHARQEACVTQDGRPQRTVLTPPAQTHRVTMGGNWPTGSERKTVRCAKIREQKTTGSYSWSVLTQIERTEMAAGVGFWHHRSKNEEHWQHRMSVDSGVPVRDITVIFHFQHVTSIQIGHFNSLYWVVCTIIHSKWLKLYQHGRPYPFFWRRFSSIGYNKISRSLLHLIL